MTLSTLRTWIALLALGPAAANAGEADVIAAEITRTAPGVYQIAVTVQHADGGWAHYADRWEVLGPGREILATRVLAHPHVGEQPFTRRLGGVRVAGGVARVTLRAHDSVHGYGGAEVDIAVPE